MIFFCSQMKNGKRKEAKNEGRKSKNTMDRKNRNRMKNPFSMLLNVMKWEGKAGEINESQRLRLWQNWSFF